MEDSATQYTVIARRFRPQSFSDVVGQQHVARALKNAIQQGRVAHAYLFTGARGVGKTSMARILAKALNCPNAVDGEPCNQCELCLSVAAGQDVDVLEIDGASNRGIDDIRQLRANVSVKSMRTKYKLYIIDEVHMLTRDAFNALLKTLEEPPPGVKFVFCTTEPNKVPDTILSRCQRFDFATIETTNIIRRLEEIAAAEGFQVEPAAVELVARRAAGSMRDSQSIFDQLLAFGGETITAADVHRLLGTASDDRLIQLVQALIDRRQSVALAQLDEALQSGVQLGELIDQLVSYLRDLMILASGTESIALLAVAPDNRETLAGQARQWGLRTIVAALEILAETKGRMFRATASRALAEMALVRLTLLADLERIDAVLTALREGSPATAGSAAGPRAAAPTQSPSSAPAQRPTAATEPAGAPAVAPPPFPTSRAQPPAAAPAVTGGTASAADDSVESAAAPASPPATARGQKKSGPLTEPAPLATFSESAEPPVGEPDGTAGGPKADLAGPAAGESEEDASANGRIPSAKGLEFVPGNEQRIWLQVVDQIQDMLRTHVRGVSFVAISGPNELDLTFPRSYHFAKQYCEQPAQVGRLEALLAKTTGRPIRVRFSLADDAAPPPEPKGASAASLRRRIPEVIEDTFVQSVMGVFGASVVRIDAVGGAKPALAAVDDGTSEGTTDDAQ